MHIFWKKSVKISSTSGATPEPPLATGGWGLRLQIPALLLPPIIITLSSSFQSPNAIYYP